MKVIFMRHAECSKNLVGLPGGPGTSLTSRGQAQARCAADDGDVRSCAVFHSPHVQTKETAAMISEAGGKQHSVLSGLSSIGLGSLSGIPISQAAIKYPDDSAAMQAWRNGEASISELDIAGMEKPIQFAVRSLDVLKTLVLTANNAEPLLIVCTTSHLIMFKHFSKGIGISSPNYKALNFDYCEYFEVNAGDILRSENRLLRD